MDFSKENSLNDRSSFKNDFFLMQLESRLQPMSKEDENEVCTQLDNSMQQYFQHFIVLKALNDYLNSKVLKEGNPLCLSADQESECSIEPVYMKSIVKYLLQNSNEENFEFLDSSQSHSCKLLRINSQGSNEEYDTNVENNIKDLCIKLLEFIHRRRMKNPRWEKAFTNSMKTLSTKAQTLDPKTKSLHPLHSELQNGLIAYSQELRKGISLLESFVQLWLRRCEYRVQYSTLLTRHIDVTSLKLKLFQSDVLLATYSDQALSALNIINEDLNNKLEDARLKKEKLQLKLEVYHVLGPKYEKLVDKYMELTEAIEKQKWAIATLGKVEPE